MNKKTIYLFAIGISLLATSIGNNNVTADRTVKCGGLSWTDKGHDDNSPSVKKFKEMAYKASLCELAKCVDHSECANHVSVDWNRFIKSPAYLGATEKQKDELNEAHKDGVGMKGEGGYEILYAVDPKRD